MKKGFFIKANNVELTLQVQALSKITYWLIWALEQKFKV